MVFFFAIMSTFVAATIVSAQRDPGAKLDKPPLQPNIDYLKQGLIDNLPETDHTYKQWAAGWIPEGCKNVAEGKVANGVVYSPGDFLVYDVTYSDVSIGITWD